MISTSGTLNGDLSEYEQSKSLEGSGTAISSKGVRGSATAMPLVAIVQTLPPQTPKPQLPLRHISLGKPVTSDVVGNLGPPAVVTNEIVADWLKDRWQGRKHIPCGYNILLLH